jgi:hypothetical protein
MCFASGEMETAFDAMSRREKALVDCNGDPRILRKCALARRDGNQGYQKKDTDPKHGRTLPIRQRTLVLYYILQTHAQC